MKVTVEDNTRTRILKPLKESSWRNWKTTTRRILIKATKKSTL